MTNHSRDEILHSIRKGLSHSLHKKREDERLFLVDKARNFKSEAKDITIQNQMIISNLLKQFVKEAEKVNATVFKVKNGGEIRDFIGDFIKDRNMKSFSVWESKYLKNLELKEYLQSKGLKVVKPENKYELARADIGVTEADYVIADTGTLVLLSDGSRPRGVSLLPTTHMAIVHPCNVISNINELFIILKNKFNASRELTSCMSFVTGPSRTADIELNLTLGVHGPKELLILLTEG